MLRLYADAVMLRAMRQMSACRFDAACLMLPLAATLRYAAVFSLLMKYIASLTPAMRYAAA